MDIEKLFTEQKWNILKELSKGSYSPLQLAKRSNTTMANISQQLNLLEFSKIVKKEKISNRDKGKPRTLFSIADDCGYIVSIMKGFAEKKLIKIDELHKIIFRVWFIKNQEAQSNIEKCIFSIEDSIDKVSCILFEDSQDSSNLTIVTEDQKDIEKAIKSVNTKKEGTKKKDFLVNLISPKELEKAVKQKKIDINSSNLEVLYDPKQIIGSLIGGDISN